MHTSSEERRTAELLAGAVTIFTALSGRRKYWAKYREFLDNVKCDTSETRIVLLDTSQSDDFGEMVRDWLADCRFRKIAYLRKRVGRAGLADVRRMGPDRSQSVELNFEIHRAMCAIYTTMKEAVHTPFVWVIEDDIIPPLDALERLGAAITPDTVSVSGVYQHRYRPMNVVAWDHDDNLLESGEGVQAIKGNGFGCVLLRTSCIQQHVFTPHAKWPDFDRAFYHRLEPGDVVKLDWSVRCEHLSPCFSPVSCPHPYEGQVSESNFDVDDYLRRYPEAAEALSNGRIRTVYEYHQRYGAAKGYIAIPREPFDEEYYLSLYPDVAAAIENGSYATGLEHYLETGQKEGRYSRVLGSVTLSIRSGAECESDR